MTQLVDQVEFHALARAGRSTDVKVFRPTAMVLRAGDAESRIVRYVLSDGTIDRCGDRIDPNGWDLTQYRRNNPVLFAHDSSAPPIGRALNVHSDGARLLGDVEFAGPDVYDFADVIFRLVRGGFLKAGSVGFRPGVFEWSDDKNRPGGIDFKKGHELLEFSVTPIGANPNALTEAKGAGIDTRLVTRWAQRWIDRPAAARERRVAQAREIAHAARLFASGYFSLFESEDLARRAARRDRGAT